MRYSNEKLNDIFDKTDGQCHICHSVLCFSNYGEFDARGSWEVEHSTAKANGGTHHLNNLYPACIRCNREKGTCDTRTARSWYGNTRAPHSRTRKQKINQENYIAGAFIGISFLSLMIGAIRNNNTRKKIKIKYK